QAIEAWSKVRHDKDPKAYARAQFRLGIAYEKQGKQDQAIEAWSKVRHDKDPKAYARAQFKLGVAYYKNKPGEAIKVWSEVRRDDDPDAYARAQFKLGEFYEGKREIEQAKEAYRNVQGPLYYRAQREYRILGCPPELINDLRSLAKNTDKVRKSLQIIPDFESKVAHYSRASTAFSLFGDEKNDKEPSHFRLSTIRGVNDPTEGLVLNDYWDQQGIPETIHTNDTATFISCFTFNHDSLNQFRLYGKEDGREATGVSLVFKKKFFSDQTDTLEFIAGPSTDPSSKSERIKPNDTGKPESDNKKQLIAKSALYRCIYLDPETGYWTLAQRDKSTFYRENKEKETAKNNWIKYSEKISKIEESFKDYLFNNNDSVLEKLKKIFKKYNKYGVKEKQKILEAVRFILLPLQYLVKHIAFQEEQECRIMYITHLHDEKIHHDWEKQWMYVEYEEHVLPLIDKIWLSPGAAKYQDFFRILLDQKEDDEPDKKEDENESKVRISQNPFRNKE
uniref:tetratricopeptide repeat protein n=2 Tax=Rothia dentocariosa TaxID=2047 RepID=UPI0028E5229C